MAEPPRESGREPGEPSIAPRRVRGYAQVTHQSESGVLEQVVAKHTRLRERLASVGALIAIASGKGGVGKSLVTANLAVTLARRGARVGVVDADLNGPSIGRMLGLPEGELTDRADGIVPPSGAAGVLGISTDLLLAQNTPLRWKGPRSDRFIWQGTTEAGVLREFLADVIWGDLEYLLVDIPPGTDKIDRFLALVPEPALVLLVTTPSEMAFSVVARSAQVLEDARVQRVGLVCNMSGYTPPGADRAIPLFSGEGAKKLTDATNLELWAEIPFDPETGSRTDSGQPPGADGASAAASAFRQLAELVEQRTRTDGTPR